MPRDTTLSELLDRYEAASRAGDAAGVREDLAYPPFALSIDEAVRCIDFVRTRADEIGPEAVCPLLAAIAGFLRQFQAPITAPGSRAVSLAYRQWLDMEGRYLGLELWPDMGIDACRLVPANTGVDKLHHAHGHRQKLLPPPSTRAVSVLTAVGIDIAEIERRFAEHQASWVAE